MEFAEQKRVNVFLGGSCKVLLSLCRGFARNRVQALDDRLRFLPRQYLEALKFSDVGLGSPDVGLSEAVIKLQRAGEGFQLLSDPFLKSPAPQPVRLF